MLELLDRGMWQAMQLSALACRVADFSKHTLDSLPWQFWHRPL
jgi:hypothetical protein